MAISRRTVPALLAAAAALAGCEGNTNDDELAFFSVTRRASLDSGEKEGNEVSSAPAVSADGRYVAFASKSTNLHPDDADLQTDIFVRDLKTGKTRLVSRATDGTKANDDCFSPDISADGRYVVFASVADNLHPDDVDSTRDVFLRDLLAGTTTLVSRDSAAGPPPAADGTKLVDPSDSPVISADGQCVAFVYGVGPGGAGLNYQIRLRDVTNRTLDIVSIDPGSGTPFTFNCTEPAISADGRYVAFTVENSSVPPPVYAVYVRDRLAATTALVSRPSGTGAYAIAADSFAPSLSSDGRYVAFESDATDLIGPGLDANGTRDIFVRDTVLDTTVRVSNANAGTEAIGDCYAPSISADGRYVAFVSDAANLVNGDTNKVEDLFVRDTVGRTTVRASVRTYGGEANDDSAEPAITADGRYVAFASVATNLVEGDNNNTIDIFVRGPLR